LLRSAIRLATVETTMRGISPTNPRTPKRGRFTGQHTPGLGPTLGRSPARGVALAGRWRGDAGGMSRHAGGSLRGVRARLKSFSGTASVRHESPLVRDKRRPREKTAGGWRDLLSENMATNYDPTTASAALCAPQSGWFDGAASAISQRPEKPSRGRTAPAKLLCGLDQALKRVNTAVTAVSISAVQAPRGEVVSVLSGLAFRPIRESGCAAAQLCDGSQLVPLERIVIARQDAGGNHCGGT
jgi:hypothetical protein